MSLISKALQKVAESRRNRQDVPMENIVYLTDAPKPARKNLLAILLVICAAAAIIMSITTITVIIKDSESNQIQTYGLEKTIKNQEKRIDDAIITVNKNQEFLKNQIHDLKIHLNKENDDINSQITNLTSAESSHYSNLKDAVIDGKQQIDSLDQYTKTLDQKIRAISTKDDQINDGQVKDATNPVIENQ